MAQSASLSVIDFQVGTGTSMSVTTDMTDCRVSTLQGLGIISHLMYLNNCITILLQFC
jgi:hypothetical protein